MNVSNKISIIISRLLVFIVMAALAVLVFAIPYITDLYVAEYAREFKFDRLKSDVWLAATISSLYLALVPAFVAIITLDRLLSHIIKGKLFINKNVLCLKLLYICCFAECVIFFGLGFFYMLSFILSFAALFMGVMLRIVKNLIEEAVLLKDENDYTI